MIRFFKVAGHCFGLELPDASDSWRLLTQYDTFGICPEDATNPLFVLKLGEIPPQDDLSLIYDKDTEDGETNLRLYAGDKGILVEMSPDHRIRTCARLWLSSDYSDVILDITAKSERSFLFSINNSMMLAFAFSTAGFGTLEMHASMVSNSGRAFLFLAKSGTGKSTHSSLWLDNVPGTELMNDDNPVVRIWPDGRVVAYGSPWSGKTPCYRNVEAPVGAFVKIRRCPDNRITRLSLLEAYAELYSSCSGLKSDPQMADGLHDTLAKAVTFVPSYVLDCRPDREAAIVCSSELLKGCRKQ